MFATLYSTLQLLTLLILSPILLPWALISAKYRQRIPWRLGLGIGHLATDLRPGPRVWIHALSVGEMASAKPLITLLRQEMPEVVILLSATTRGGEMAALRLRMDNLVDLQVPFPFDLPWVTDSFVRLLRPDLFVLVETDFWPNLMSRLRRQGIPALLINGRITGGSLSWYRRLRPLFAPLFQGLSKISMQTADGAKALASFGVNPAQIAVCGNLKYDIPPAKPSKHGKPPLGRSQLGLGPGPLLVAGSTHKGEEDILMAALVALRQDIPELAMVIAPRQIERARQIVALAKSHGLSCHLRTNQGNHPPAQLVVLDTLGELAQVYQLADLAFVGGSLVPEGGHNPLEPAALAKPVLFGPEMTDFAEISQSLLAAGGAMEVKVSTVPTIMAQLLSDTRQRQEMGQRAKQLVDSQRGAARRTLELIRETIAAHG